MLPRPPHDTTHTHATDGTTPSLSHTRFPLIGNSPMEVSSKRPVGRHRNVVDVKTKAGAHFGKAAKTTTVVRHGGGLCLRSSDDGQQCVRSGDGRQQCVRSNDIRQQCVRSRDIGQQCAVAPSLSLVMVMGRRR